MTSSEVKKRRRRKRGKIILFICLLLFAWFWFSLPRQLFTEPTSFVIEDREGALLSASVSADGQWRFPDISEVPYKFETCILTYEDKRFYSHIGIDFLSLGRAIRQNFSQNRVVSGASTISMQVIRLSRKKPRTIFQKCIEMILALRLELRYSKKEILAMYVSHEPFGGNVVGIDAASWRYFGRSPQLLSWGEAAALAVLPNAPSLVHPGKNQDILKRKRDELLHKLYEQKIIDELTYQSSIEEPLPGEPKSLPNLTPHLLNKFRGDYKNYKASTRLQSTIDKTLQEHVIQIAQYHSKTLKKNEIHNIAIMVLDVESGDVLAYMGNLYQPTLPETESFVDVIQAPRSPGSLLKPLLYEVALHDGLLLPHTLLPDIPTQIGGYMPQNFDKNYDGAASASNAISRSLNIPAVRLLREYKYPRFYAALQQGGIRTLTQSPDYYGLSLILGGCEVSLWQVAGLYASLARAYLHADPEDGSLHTDDFFMPHYELQTSAKEQYHPHMSFPSDAVSLWYMLQAMEEVARPGEESYWQFSSTAQQIAWKTGTSFGYRDAWALGISTKYLVGVWVGNADGEGRPGLIGVRAAAPVMFDVFQYLPSSRWFEPPSAGYVYLSVCNESGFKAGPYCSSSKEMMLPKAGQRTALCPYHTLIMMHPTLNYQVNESCFSPLEMRKVSWFVLPPAMEYYYRLNHPEYKPLPPFMEGCAFLETKKHMSLIYPLNMSRIYIPIELSGERGELVCQAVHKHPKETLYWHLDKIYLGKTEGLHNMPVQAQPGWHTLTIIDESGEKITVRFEILEK